MSMSRDELLNRIDGEATPGARKRIRALFEEANSSSCAMKPVRGKADEALRLWQTRLITSGLPILSLNGIRMLVRKLATMPPDAEVEQFGFTGKTFAGSVFFDRASGKFLGDTIVRRRAKSRQMQELEAQLLQPSRKSA
jgi:hypothetical protein